MAATALQNLPTDLLKMFVAQGSSVKTYMLSIVSIPDQAGIRHPSADSGYSVVAVRVHEADSR